MTNRTSFIGALLALFLTLTATPAQAAAPPGVAAAPTTWAAVSSGSFHTCGIRTDRVLFCWGWNDQRQLGLGEASPPFPRPVGVGTGYQDWVSVAAGTYHTCAIRAAGRLYCWGDDGEGQLGNGPGPSNGHPQEVAGGFRDWTAVTAGGHHTCALRRNGALYCWGNDAYGQVGNGPTTGPFTSPMRVAGTYRFVDAGAGHTCAVAADAGLRCWGDDGAAQLGNGPGHGSIDSPTGIVGAPRRWRVVTAGESHTCAVAQAGRAFCWGDDTFGQLGNGPVGGAQESPVAVDTVETFAGISAGSVHTCARNRNAEVRCWGGDANGQLGDGSTSNGSPRPNGALTPFSAGVSAGGYHGCSRTTVGRLQCWGDNSRGQVGRGNQQLSYPAPVAVLRALEG